MKIQLRDVAEALWRGVALIVAIAILVIVATRWNRWQGAPGWQSTDDAYLQSDLTPIAAKVAGYLTSFPVQDFQRVRAGQLIAQVFEGDYRAALAQALASRDAALAQAQALHAQRDLQAANIAAAEAGVASTTAALAQSRRDIDRQAQLMATGSSSQEAAEKLATGRDQLAAQLAQNRAQTQAARRQLAVLAAQEQQALAQAASAAAAADLARLNLGYTRIVAPADGVIGQRQVKPGQYVAVGAQLTSLLPLPRVWVLANFRETQLAHMAPGQAARITVDAYPGRTLRGHVLAFSPGAGSVFALLPPDNATGNFTKVVQRLPVKIAIDDDAGLGERLRPGLSVVARVDARDSPR